jgi:hypothetical protein
MLRIVVTMPAALTFVHHLSPRSEYHSTPAVKSNTAKVLAPRDVKEYGTATTVGMGN